MVLRHLFLIFTFCFFGCGFFENHDAHESDPPESIDLLESNYGSWVSESEELRDENNGWIMPTSCDGMLHTGLWASSPGINDVDITAAEYPDEPGRFGRRPPPRCYDDETGDQGSPASFSRDMGKGLIIYSYRKGKLDILERHAQYGIDNNWLMGKPVADGRAQYTPAMIGELYQSIYALGGEDSLNRKWPNVYTKGLDDFQAHLQVLSIYLRGLIAENLNDAALLDINGVMYDRVLEHAEREPTCPFYEYMRAVYTDGDLEHATDLVLSDDWDCEYMRDEDAMRLAIKTFVGGLILERVGRVSQ